MRRYAQFLMILMLLVAIVATVGANGSAEETSPDDGFVEIDAIWMAAQGRYVDKPSLFDEAAEEFGIRFNWQADIPDSDAAQKINLLFVTGDYPEMFTEFNGSWGGGAMLETYNQLVEQDRLLPVNDFLDRMPNYSQEFSDEEWDILFSTGDPNGNIHIWPSRNYRTASQAWVYRAGAFEELGLDFPTTFDELFDTMAVIKENDPDAIPLSTRNGVRWLTRGFLLGAGVEFGMDSMTGEYISQGLMIHPRTRETLQFLNRAYAAGFIDQEFATATREQWTRNFTSGRAYIMWEFATRDAWANDQMSEVDPDANWQWSDELISLDAETRPSYMLDLPSFNQGPVLTDKLEGESLDRIIEFFDWVATDEGSRWMTFGKEGVTYETVNGAPQYLDTIDANNDNPEGTPLWSYGVYGGAAINPFLKMDRAFYDQYGATMAAVSSWVENAEEPFFFYAPWIGINYPEEERRRLNDLSVVRDVYEENITKFIIGVQDPFSDEEWSRYVDTINRAGLQEMIEIERAGFARKEAR